MKVTAYGPHATPERTAEAAAVMEAVGAAAELLASMVPAGGCILLGRREHVDALAPWPAGLAPFPPRPHRLAPLPRAELVETLRGLGREECARKVEGGPLDQPQPEGAVLLVVAMADAVGVTWSHARRSSPRTNARGGRA
ncbi:MAG: hypothetical protein U0324_29270 [Polyangiales bacterium]